MSLSTSLTNVINEVIMSYTKLISDKYNLDNNELTELWNNGKSSTPSKPSKPISSIAIINKDLSHENLLKYTNKELGALCKSNGYKCTGTKGILINRLLGKDPDGKVVVKKVKKSSEPIIIKKVIANIPNIVIRRNSFNNYEHPDTHLVFDNETKIVIGKQNDDGSIDTLSKEDINQCNAFKFKFKCPDNLDDNKTKKDDDDDDEEDEDEDEEELCEEELIEDIVEEDDEDEEEEELLEEYYSE